MTGVPGGQTQDPELERDKLELEKEKLELEKDKLTFERENEKKKLEVEQKKAWITALGIGIPILVAAVTVVGNSYLQNQASLDELELQKQTALNNFTLKAAEIIMGQDTTPSGTKNKADALSQIFRGQLPSDFADSFDPSNLPVKFNPDEESRARFLQFAVERPNDSIQEILKAWRALFPDNKWAQTVSIEKLE